VTDDLAAIYEPDSEIRDKGRPKKIWKPMQVDRPCLCEIAVLFVYVYSYNSLLRF
jgi:hypothetical protein